jgi:hypothetical protein
VGGVVLGFKFKASPLLGRCSLLLEPHLQSFFILFFVILELFAQVGLDHDLHILSFYYWNDRHGHHT